MEDFLVSRLVTVNSANKLEGSLNARFSVDLGNSGNTGIVKSKLVSLSVVNAFYNVINPEGLTNATLNGTTSTGGVFSIVVPNGQYNNTQIFAFLKDALETHIGSGTVTFSIKNGYLTNIVTTVGTIQIDAMLSTGVGSVAELLGFTVDSAVNADITSDAMINLEGLKSIFIRSLKMSPGNAIESSEGGSSSSGVTDLLASVPLDADFGKILHFYKFDSELYTVEYAEPIQIDNIDITLTNSSGRLLILPPQMDIHLVLKLYMLK